LKGKKSVLERLPVESSGGARRGRVGRKLLVSDRFFYRGVCTGSDYCGEEELSELGKEINREMDNCRYSFECSCKGNYAI